MNDTIRPAITVDHVMAMNPCSDYDRQIITELWSGRAALEPSEVAGLGIPTEDRLWCLLRWPGLTDAGRRLLACDFAARVLPVWEAAHPDDDRPRWAIEVARRYAMGEATYAEMRSAADATAYAADAAADAAYRAACAARASTAYVGGHPTATAYAADAAADAAAYAAYAADAADAERDWQLAHTVAHLNAQIASREAEETNHD